MEIVEFAVPGSKPFAIATIGDLQWNGDPDEINCSGLEQYIQRALDANAYFVGHGDYPMPLAARILTQRGFISHADIKVGELVLAYDVEQDCCRWTPLRGIVRPGILPMLQLTSKSFRVRATPQHTWAVTQQWWKRAGTRRLRRTFQPYLVPTEHLKKHQRIIVAAPIIDEPKSVLSAEEARVLGWLCTDGHVKTKPTLCGYILQTKEPYRTHLRGLLVDWVTKEEQATGPCSRFHLKTKRLRALFESAQIEPKGYKTQLPSLVTQLSQEARTAMWIAMVEAEGWREGGHWRFSQKPGPVLDAFRILSALLGYRLTRGKLNKGGVVTVAVLDYRRFVTVAGLSIMETDPEACWCPQTDYGTWVAELDGQVTITGNTDFASPSSRARLTGSGAYDGPMQKMDDIARELTHQVYNRFLKPTKGRWAGCLEGHHFWQMKDGTTTDMELCRLLGTTHLGTEAVIEWVIRNPYSSATNRLRFQTWHHHGWGAGEESAMLMRLKKVAADWDGVNGFFIGHATKLATTIVPKLRAVVGRKHATLIERRVLLAGTGGWSKGKVVGRRDGRVPRGGYVERGGLRPVSLGAPLVDVVIESVKTGHADETGNRERHIIIALEAHNR